MYPFRYFATNLEMNQNITETGGREWCRRGRVGSTEAIVVGAGPNGLAAAIRLARAGLSVLVLEARKEPGGGATTAELTLPGFLHDICSSVFPLGAGSPFFRTLPLGDYGLEWVQPTTPLAHPLGEADAAALERDSGGGGGNTVTLERDPGATAALERDSDGATALERDPGGAAAALERDPGATARALGPDGDAWLDLFRPFTDRGDELLRDVLAPLHWPSHPRLMARFGLQAVRSAAGLARARFKGPRARALLAGCAAHSSAPLNQATTAAIGLLLAGSGHAYGWPFARGGARAVTAALAGYVKALGGRIECSAPVHSLAELPPARVVMLDLVPRGVLRVAGERLPGRYRRALERYRYGPGIFKIDWALDAPIPWTAPACHRAGTVHVGGTMEEVVKAENAVRQGKHAERPFVLLSQPSRFDSTRAPEGKHVAWAYCHVPHGSRRDMTGPIEDTVERFAPGFRDRILARHVMNTADLADHDANIVGGDIAGGAMVPRQIFFRPTARPKPYRMPLKGVYICSSSTPPGPGVHGMCGYHAAETALADL